MLNIFSLTLSFKGLVVDDFINEIVFPFNFPLIILIFFNYSPTNIFPVQSFQSINFKILII